MKANDQLRMFWRAHRQISDANNLFMDMVRDGDITAAELRANIARRPSLWGRFAGFLDKLP